MGAYAGIEITMTPVLQVVLPWLWLSQVTRSSRRHEVGGAVAMDGGGVMNKALVFWHDR